MAGFRFRLEIADGAPADPPTPTTAAPSWGAGDAITLSAGRKLLVLAIRDDESDEPPVLVVEDAVAFRRVVR
jgi:hypothetical protein